MARRRRPLSLQVKAATVGDKSILVCFRVRVTGSVELVVLVADAGHRLIDPIESIVLALA